MTHGAEEGRKRIVPVDNRCRVGYLHPPTRGSSAIAVNYNKTAGGDPELASRCMVAMRETPLVKSQSNTDATISFKIVISDHSLC